MAKRNMTRRNMMRQTLTAACAAAMLLAACSSDGSDRSDDTVTAEDDSAPVSAPGGPTTTVAEARAVDPADVPDGGWVAGEHICEPPPDDDDTPLTEAHFVSPATLAPGEAIEVALDGDTVASAAEIDAGEVETFGGDFVLLTCWSDGGWTPVWLVRLPGFAALADDGSDADDLGGDDEILEAGAVADEESYPLGADVAIAGIELTEPFAVAAVVPADVPPGTYRWTTSVGVSGSRVTLTQPVEITAN